MTQDELCRLAEKTRKSIESDLALGVKLQKSITRHLPYIDILLNSGVPPQVIIQMIQIKKGSGDLVDRVYFNNLVSRARVMFEKGKITQADL